MTMDISLVILVTTSIGSIAFMLGAAFGVWMEFHGRN